MPSPVWLVDSPYRTLPNGDALRGPRAESWRVEMLALDGTPLGPLDGCQSVRLEWTAARDVRGTGSLTWAGWTPPAWLGIRLQPWYQATFPDGTTTEWPVGVFIPGTPEAKWGDDGATLDVDLYDTLTVLVESKVTSTYTVAAGANVTAAVRALLTGAGIPARDVAVTDSTETARTSQVWEVGTTRLRIINDLLASINYFSLDVDGYGTFHTDPYVPPAGRSSVWDFDGGTASIDSPEFTHERDLYNVPNSVTLVTQSDGYIEGLSWTESLPASHPLSAASRGYSIDETESGVEASSLAVLKDMTKRRLAELTQVTSAISLQHWLIPLGLNDVVTFTDDAAGIDLRAVVQSRGVDLLEDGTALASARIKEVTT